MEATRCEQCGEWSGTCAAYRTDRAIGAPEGPREVVTLCAGCAAVAVMGGEELTPMTFTIRSVAQRDGAPARAAQS